MSSKKLTNADILLLNINCFLLSSEFTELLPDFDKKHYTGNKDKGETLVFHYNTPNPHLVHSRSKEIGDYYIEFTITGFKAIKLTVTKYINSVETPIYEGVFFMSGNDNRLSQPFTTTEVYRFVENIMFIKIIKEIKLKKSILSVKELPKGLLPDLISMFILKASNFLRRNPVTYFETCGFNIIANIPNEREILITKLFNKL